MKWRLTRYASGLLGVEPDEVGLLSTRDAFALLRGVRGGSAFTNYAEDQVMGLLPNPSYAKVHLGSPGEDATSNAATETTRKSFVPTASSGGVRSNTGVIQWASYPAAETVSHVSVWDAATSGNPWFYGALTASKVMVIGDTLEISAGQLQLAAA